jgi:hypothetical protein
MLILQDLRQLTGNFYSSDYFNSTISINIGPDEDSVQWIY